MSIATLSVLAILESLWHVHTQLAPPLQRLLQDLRCSTDPRALQLAFLPLRPGVVVEVRSSGIYVAESEPPCSEAQVSEGPCWLVFRSPFTNHSFATGVDTVALGREMVAAEGDDELGPVLEAFHFFEPLIDHVPALAKHDESLASQIRQVHAIRSQFPREFNGDEIITSSCLVVCLTGRSRVHLDLVLPHDDLPPGAALLPAATADSDGRQRFVLLGHDLQFEFSRLVRLA